MMSCPHISVTFSLPFQFQIKCIKLPPAMTEILRSKNLSTKLQILVEVAANQPDVQQRNIAKRLGISPQAVSDYIRALVADGWLKSDGRSRYRVTQEGVDWIVKELREWQGYSNRVLKVVGGISISAAVADCSVSKGQEVGLSMRDGLLFATDDPNASARGIAASDAEKGEDVGVSNIQGIVPLEVGKVTVVRLPGVQKGGSRKANIGRLKKMSQGKKMVGAIGVEALIALRKAGIDPDYEYGVREAVIEAARSGLSPTVACVDNDTADLIRLLEEKGIDYDIVDGR